MEYRREQLKDERDDRNSDTQDGNYRDWHRQLPQALSGNSGRRGFVDSNRDQLARGLGWFSIGLGLTEVLAPRSVERFLGAKQRGVLMRLMGLREIAAGIGILAARQPAGWLWARVAGDVVDIASLSMAANSETAKPANIAFAGAAVLGITALDVCCAQEFSQENRPLPERQGIEVRKSIQINRSPEELYRFWRNFQNLPQFMSNLESVQTTSDRRSHWVVRGPAGKRIRWDAEIVDEQENSFIAWRSLEGAQVENHGSVQFKPAPRGRGTFVKVRIVYNPPGGILGATVAKLFGRAPEQQVHEDLQHLKQIMEAGEIITTEGQPAGRARSTSWKYDQTIRRQVNARSDHQSSAA